MFPPDLMAVAAAYNATTTSTDSTLLSAPGSGVRYRVWAINIWPALDMSGSARIALVNNNEFFTTVVSNTRMEGDLFIFPNGLQWNSNTSVVVRYYSNTEVQGFGIRIYYTLERP